MCKHYSGIGQQLLQKASVLMTEGKCSDVHNLKCCFSPVLEGEELKRQVLSIVGTSISFLWFAEQEF